MTEHPFTTSEKMLCLSGKGQMNHTELFPGIELSVNYFNASQISFQHEALPEVLEINYCRAGRIGWDMRDGFSVYLGPGDMDLHTMDYCAASTMNLPLGYYEGITVSIDIRQISSNPPDLIRESGINGNALLRKLFAQGRPFSLPASDETGRIFEVLFHLPEHLCIPYYKLKVQELLLYLERLRPDDEKILDQYYSAQVECIKEIHTRMTKDLNRRYTIDELSKLYLMNTSSLKSIFKAVYGQPIASYMKEYRMRRAMELLRQTDESIAEIAQMMGYENQGKFTKAFKDIVQMNPLEFRQHCRAGA